MEMKEISWRIMNLRKDNQNRFLWRLPSNPTSPESLKSNLRLPSYEDHTTSKMIKSRNLNISRVSWIWQSVSRGTRTRPSRHLPRDQIRPSWHLPRDRIRPSWRLPSYFLFWLTSWVQYYLAPPPLSRANEPNIMTSPEYWKRNYLYISRVNMNQTILTSPELNLYSGSSISILPWPPLSRAEPNNLNNITSLKEVKPYHLPSKNQT